MAASKVKSKSVKPKKSLVKNKISSKVKLTAIGGIGAVGLGALAFGINKMKGSKTNETKSNTKSDTTQENKKLIEMLNNQQETIKNLQKNIIENENKFNKHIEMTNKEIISIKKSYEELDDTVKNIMEKVKWKIGLDF